MMNFRLSMNNEYCKNRFSSRLGEAQKWLDNEVLKDSTPYTPMDTGALMRSGIAATNIGSGEVIWNVPYAARCYYGTHLHFQTGHHPQASAQWFEKAKSANKQKWVNGVQTITRN